MAQTKLYSVQIVHHARVGMRAPRRRVACGLRVAHTPTSSSQAILRTAPALRQACQNPVFSCPESCFLMSPEASPGGLDLSVLKQSKHLQGDLRRL